MQNFLRNIKISAVFHKYLYLGMLVLVIGQQIYAPHQLGYFHLALLFVFMVFNDMRAFSQRNIGLELTFVAGIAIAVLSGIASRLCSGGFAWLYASGMVLSGSSAVLYFLELQLIVAHGQREKISEKHQMIFDKPAIFLRLMLFAAIAVVVIADAYVISEIL